MIKNELEIINRLGLHARAAAKFVDLASHFRSNIEVERQGRTVNGKSIMGVMMLAAGKGKKINVSIDGDDAELAMKALTSLVANRFGESE